MFAIGTRVRFYSPPDGSTLFGIVRRHFTASVPFTWHKVEVTIGGRSVWGTRVGEFRYIPADLLTPVFSEHLGQS